MAGTPGTLPFTSDNAVGISGKPVRVWNVELLSGGAAGNLVLRNGTSDSSTIKVNQPGTINRSVTFNWANGILFPNGCFYDHDANTTSADITFSMEL